MANRSRRRLFAERCVQPLPAPEEPYGLAFSATGERFKLAASNGFLSMGAFALYGLAASFLGPLGTSIGWGLMQIFMIAAATASGIFTGEWNASRSALFFLSCGLTALGFAIALLAKGNR
jgi:hypothetical protein